MTKNKKILIAIFATGIMLLFPWQRILAQDKLVFTDGSELSTKVLEINEKQIKYKRFDFQDGPVYIVNKTEVATILYESGQTEMFTDMKKEETSVVKDEKPLGERTNIISLHLFDMIYFNYAISYEKISENGKLAVEIPVGMGIYMEDGPVFTEWQPLYFGGIGFKYYPTGQNTVSYFVGPMVKFGYAENAFINSFNERVADKANFMKAHLINGISISPVSSINMQAQIGFGVRAFDIYELNSGDNYDFFNGLSSSFYASFMIGYRF